MIEYNDFIEYKNDIVKSIANSRNEILDAIPVLINIVKSTTDNDLITFNTGKEKGASISVYSSTIYFSYSKYTLTLQGLDDYQNNNNIRAIYALKKLSDIIKYNPSDIFKLVTSDDIDDMTELMKCETPEEYEAAVFNCMIRGIDIDSALLSIDIRYNIYIKFDKNGDAVF